MKIDNPPPKDSSLVSINQLAVEIARARNLTGAAFGLEVVSITNSAFKRASKGEIQLYQADCEYRFDADGLDAFHSDLRLTIDDANSLKSFYLDPLAHTEVPSSKLEHSTETSESSEERQARRYQMCIDAKLKLPTNDYAPLPRGIGKLAKLEGITRQGFAADVKKHLNRR